MTSRKKTVLITGATGGIGYAFAEKFAKENNDVYALGRDLKKLKKMQEDFEKTYSVDLNILHYDLSEPGNFNLLFEEINRMNVQFDILVNNAGVGVYGYFHETDQEREIAMINLNITALTLLTKFFLKKMIHRGGGKIINVASTASFKPGPMMAVYYATKSYVLSFTKAISFEAEKHGIKVIALCPGPTKTNFQNGSSIFSKTNEDQINKMSAPEIVADRGIRSLGEDKVIVVPGIKNKINVLVSKILPDKMLMNILYHSRIKKAE